MLKNTLTIAFCGLILLLSACRQGNEYDNFTVAPNIQIKIPDFQVQTILKGSGEFLSITTDPMGRLLISPRYGELIRVTISSDNSASVSIDTLPCGVTDCQGLLYAYHSLYMMGTGPDDVRGIYRLIDRDGRGDFDEPELLIEMPRNGDHSGHTLTLGPEGKIYFLTGNENKPPQLEKVRYMHQNWATDHLMPLRSIYGGIQGPPGGFVMRTDSAGTAWEFMSWGLRNPYDMCFNQEGELFTFDSDMEWDFGLPWYRPIRVNHLVSGADFAWREITAKRFDYYPDIWPSVLDLGRGSPTGTVFGSGSHFPVKYQEALFLGDWSYGRIYALHLTPDGASYKGEAEVFATGKPLNVTDMIIGMDGALYFITGGNGTDTGLFRIIYKGKNTSPPKTKLPDSLLALRKKIESYHFSEDTTGIHLAMKYMDHPDRFIRSASRVVLEKNPLDVWMPQWQEDISIDGLLNYQTAIIRTDVQNVHTQHVISSICNMDWDQLTEDQRLGLLRIISLLFIRNERLTEHDFSKIHHYLYPRYPSTSALINKELSRNLGYLAIRGYKTHDFILKSLDLIESTSSQELLIHYLEVMRKIPYGWSPDQRLAYKYWIDYALVQFKGGSLFQYFLGEIKKDFESTLTPAEKVLLERQKVKPLNDAYDGPFKPKNVERRMETGPASFVKNWTFEDLEFSLELVNSPRNPRERDFHRGKAMFEKGLCYNCHLMLDRGGSFGPELTYAGNSFGIEELTHTILSPSATINSRFQGTDFTLKDGSLVSGRILSETNTHYVISKDWTGENIEEIPKSSLTETSPSHISEMPPGLINTMEKDEILDLLFFISEIPGKKEDLLSFDIFESKARFENGDSSLIEMTNYSDKGGLYYQLGDEEFTPYTGPFWLHQTTRIAAYKILDSQRSDTVRRVIHSYDKDLNGLSYNIFSNVAEPFGLVDVKDASGSGIARRINVRDLVQDQNNFRIDFEGFLKVETAGSYRFYASFDDALIITVDNQKVIDAATHSWGGNDEGEIILAPGMIPIRIQFYDRLSTEYLTVEYEGPEITRTEIPAHRLFIRNK